MPANNSGRMPTQAIEPRHRPPGQRWILDGGLRGGGPGRSFWRTPEESCKGLGSVTLKINTQHTPYTYAQSVLTSNGLSGAKRTGRRNARSNEGEDCQ